MRPLLAMQKVVDAHIKADEAARSSGNGTPVSEQQQQRGYDAKVAGGKGEVAQPGQEVGQEEHFHATAVDGCEHGAWAVCCMQLHRANTLMRCGKERKRERERGREREREKGEGGEQGGGEGMCVCVRERVCM